MAAVAHLSGQSLNCQLSHQLRLQVRPLITQQSSLHHAFTEAARKLDTYPRPVCDTDDANENVTRCDTQYITT